MNTRFSLLDLDIDTTTHTYGVFLGNWLNINKDGKLNADEHSLLRVEYSMISGWELFYYNKFNYILNKIPVELV